MSTEDKPYNEPAFPCNSPDGLYSYSGMTLRDYFAARALDGCIRHMGHVDGTGDSEWFAEKSYEIADAMLRERTKP